jgi:hypothetical protein
MKGETKQIRVGGERLDKNNNVIRSKPLDLTITDNAQFERELAMAAWAEALDRLAIDFVYKPTVKVGGKVYRPDFYLKSSDTFVVIKNIKFAGEQGHYDDEITEFALAAERDVVVGYTDGKFRLADYRDRISRADDGESVSDTGLYLDEDAWLCACYYCEQFFFCTNVSSWACRNCRHYDGDATAAFVLHGDDSIFDLPANLQSRRRKNTSQTKSIRELVYGKQS